MISWHRCTLALSLESKALRRQYLVLTRYVFTAWSLWFQQKQHFMAVSFHLRKRCNVFICRQTMRSWLLACARANAVQDFEILPHAHPSTKVSEMELLHELRKQRTQILGDSANLVAEARSQCASIASLRSDLAAARVVEGRARSAEAREETNAAAAEAMIVQSKHGVTNGFSDDIVCAELERQVGEAANLQVATQSAVAQAAIRLSARSHDAATAEETNQVLQEQLNFVTSQYAAALTTLDSELALLSGEESRLQADALRLRASLQELEMQQERD